MRKITVVVQRYSKDRGTYEQTYTVSAGEKEILSVMNLLEHIYQNLDGTLAFFSHAACKQAACGKCAVKYNGKTVLACKASVDSDEVRLAPCRGDVVRDLVCR